MKKKTFKKAKKSYTKTAKGGLKLISDEEAGTIIEGQKTEAATGKM